jgi:5-formyltetrahydrofolate cyclo-ligase
MDSDTPSQLNFEKAKLRNQMRTVRAAIDAPTRASAETKLAERLLASGKFLAGSKVAVYSRIGSEISLAPAIALLQNAQVELFLPITTVGEPLKFARLQGSLRSGNYGILEPTGADRLASLELDFVLMPLLAFDKEGNRLGQGGGFYDRSFDTHAKKPERIGIGFGCQFLSSIPSAPLDLRLHSACTELGWIRFD